MKRALLLLLLTASCASTHEAAPVHASGSLDGLCQSTAECGAAQVCREGSCVACAPVCNMLCVRGSHCGPDADGCMGCFPDVPQADGGP